MSRVAKQRVSRLQNDLCLDFARGCFAGPRDQQVFAFRRMVARAFPVPTVVVKVRSKWISEDEL